MNTQVTPVVLAPCFPDFVVADGLRFENNRVQFSLSHKFSDAQVECSMPVLACTLTIVLNDTPDPQNDIDHDLDSWKATEYTLVDTLQVEGVAIKEGQQFLLTSDQIYSLNKKIEWLIEEQFFDGIEQLKSHIAEYKLEEMGN